MANSGVYRVSSASNNVIAPSGTVVVDLTTDGRRKTKLRGDQSVGFDFIFFNIVACAEYFCWRFTS